MNGVSKIIVTEDVALITFHKLSTDPKTTVEIFGAFAEEAINIDMISQSSPSSSAVSLSFTVAGSDLMKVLELINRLRESHPSLKPLVSSSNNKIQLYGEEMRELYGVASKAIASIASEGVEINLITTSEVDISFLVGNAHLPQALKALEETFQLS